MRDNYLWDRSGQPDPEVQRLEGLLSGFRSRRPAPDFSDSDFEIPGSRFRFTRRRFAAAAVILVLLGGGWLLYRWSRPSWEIAGLAGAPRVGGQPIDKTTRLGVGEWLETDGDSRAMINVGQIGQVEIEPNSRVQLVWTRLAEHRLALSKGTIRATIWAPPGLFFVDTPSAVAIDLGCAYTLQVDESGAAMLHVKYGWVAFEHQGRESFVPAEATCRARPGTGPGTPCWEDTSTAFRDALEKVDFEQLDPAMRAEALGLVLSGARDKDAFTLWHLLSRVEAEEREAVYVRMTELVPPPEGVTREGVLVLDRRMLDRWWDHLGLRDTTWWRMWKGPSPMAEK
ncbi:MAG: hypothetical protein HY650_10285 [Acidobacteria bacterium]|nr:hypothetical protein [Acidobacteriota bacterium]